MTKALENMGDRGGCTGERGTETLDREMYLAAVMRLAAVDGLVDSEERVISEVAIGLGLGPVAAGSARLRPAIAPWTPRCSWAACGTTTSGSASS